ncbi:MAG: NAD-binding protein [Lautropia sp.]|nr:NAD-binding protein [Lautropia sp.]
MSEVLYIILRRLRAPLITLIVVYAISVLGLALMPGSDPAGNPWRLGFFHAFYVMSYTATTIGFGELPFPYSDAQRAWLILSIYLSVIGWTYALGSIFALTTDPTFRSTVARSIFRWRAIRLTDPFFIVCGCGQSGAALAHALDRMGYRLVLLDVRPDRAARIAIAEFTMPPVVLVADARNPEVLSDAGIHKPECKGVIALTKLDSANQTISIGAKVLRNEMLVIARVKDSVESNNLSAFGGVHIINPFRVLATNIGLDIAAPEVLRLEDWLTGAPGSPCPSRVNVPKGPWVLVGYGRFGQSITEILDEAHVDWRAIDPGASVAREARVLAADNTESALRAAGILKAGVVVAGTDSDTVNLGVTTLARRLNPDIFVVVRQNDAADRVLIDAARSNLRFVQSDLIVRECLQILKTPLFGDFITRIRAGGSTQASKTIELIMATVGNASPRNWEFRCDTLQPGMFGAFFQTYEEPLQIRHLLVDPADRDRTLSAAAVYLVSRGQNLILPPPDTELKPGDRLLFIGRERARIRQLRFLYEPGVFDYVRTGLQPPQGWLFRKLQSMRTARLKSAGH